MEMPGINQRFKALIDKEGNGSVRYFANMVGIKSSQKLNRIFHPDPRSGKYPKPSTDMILAIANKFSHIDLKWLLTGERANAQGETSISARMPDVVTVDSEGKENILMVPIPAQAGYLDQYDDEQFLSELPSYRLPKIANGTFRMFEVAGHSMYPTIHAGAIAVGEWCDNWIDDIKDNFIYIIVHKTDGIVIKRCLNRIKKYGNLFLKSDNQSEYPSYPVKADNIVEVWKLKTAFIYDFQDPADVYNRMNDLEAELLQLKSKLR